MRSIIITSLLFLCYSQILFSATIYVNKAIAGGLENGSSWANAFTNLQDAIDAASAGDEIWVVAGTYVPTKDKMGVANVNDRSNTFYITKNIKIYGGFVGTETLLSQRNYETNITILSGDMDNDADNSDNAYHLIYIDGTTANGNITNTMILDGFTIQKGNANGGGDNNNGGGILINGKGAGKAASPTISNCKFKDNTAENGGAMYNYGNLSGTSNPICINVTFSSNRATFGGAIYNNGDGSQCNPTFNKCTFVNNFGTNYGGVIFHYGYGSTSTPTFTACNFTANTTSGYGGVLYINSYFGDCKPTFTNCLFSGNIAQEGGVLANDASFYGKSTVEITNCTFYNNNATGSAYDLISNWGSTNTTNIKNSILWDGTAINTAGGTTTINYCIFDDGIPDGSVALPSGSTGSNNLDSDPLFTDKVNNDFSLQSSSPAKNTGTNSDAPSTDITGANRSDGLIDIGAYEYGAVLPVELTYFKGELIEKNAVLTWQTASEIKNHGFEIERSQDGKYWKNIGFVFGKGTTRNISNYEFTDEIDLRGLKLYYRLKQIDLDGKFEHSNIINLTIEASNNTKFQIFPNPVADQLTITNGQGIAVIYNSLGQAIQSFNIQQSPFQINTSDLSKGQYLLQLKQADGNIHSQQFIK